MGVYEVYCSISLTYGIYRVGHKNVNNFFMIRCSIRKYTEKPISFVSLQVSGTIKSLEKLEHTFDTNIQEHSETNYK